MTGRKLQEMAHVFITEYTGEKGPRTFVKWLRKGDEKKRLLQVLSYLCEEEDWSVVKEMVNSLLSIGE